MDGVGRYYGGSDVTPAAAGVLSWDCYRQGTSLREGAAGTDGIECAAIRHRTGLADCASIPVGY